MSLALIGALVALALIDSTSIGTLLLPIFFLLRPGRLHVGRYLTYLVTISVFYAVVGVALLIGGRVWLSDLSELGDNPWVARIGLAIGLVMFIGSFFMGKSGRQGPGRFARWRDRAMDSDRSGGSVALVGLALLAATAEVATMLPYLGAIGLLATSDLSGGAQIGLLVAYCFVMVLPALVLLALRIGARSFIEPPLRRLAAWMERSSGETTAWIVGIVGFLIIRATAGPAGLVALIEQVEG